MAVPLIPFVAGAVVGGLAAYFYKDENVRREVRRAAADVSDAVSHNLDELKHRIKPEERTTEAKPAATKKTAKKKKPAAKKKPSTKKKAAGKPAKKKKKAAKTTSAKDKPQ